MQVERTELLLGTELVGMSALSLTAVGGTRGETGLSEKVRKHMGVQTVS